MRIIDQEYERATRADAEDAAERFALWAECAFPPLRGPVMTPGWIRLYAYVVLGALVALMLHFS